MKQSHVIEHEGVFLGTAVPLPHTEGLRFIALNPRVAEIDGSVWPTLAEVRRIAAELSRTGKLGGRRAGLFGRSAA